MVPCPHCGAPLFGSTTKRCYKCGNDVAIDDRTEAQRKQLAEKEEARRKRREDPVLRKRFAKLIAALEGGNAGVVHDVRVLSGTDGWAAFTDRYLGARFTCLPCSSCGFVLVREFSPAVDASWIVRNEGTASADNWKVFFNCVRCGTSHRGLRVSISYDGESAIGKKAADPIADVFGVPKKKWWAFWS